MEVFKKTSSLVSFFRILQYFSNTFPSFPMINSIRYSKNGLSLMQSDPKFWIFSKASKTWFCIYKNRIFFVFFAKILLITSGCRHISSKDIRFNLLISSKKSYFSELFCRIIVKNCFHCSKSSNSLK